jgi:DNA-binding XRE family transcriptional regulator
MTLDPSKWRPATQEDLDRIYGPHGLSIFSPVRQLETRTGGLGHDGLFGQRLRQRRLLKGWRQADLARKAGMSKNGNRTLQDWERGFSSPRVGGRIVRVAEALGVEVQWLLWGDDEPPVV